MKQQLVKLGCLLLLVQSCAHHGPRLRHGKHYAHRSKSATSVLATHRHRLPSALSAAPDYPMIFSKAREVMIPADKNLRRTPENLVVDELQSHPELLEKSREELLAALESVPVAPLDPTNHLRLIPPPGRPGYSNLKLHVNHPYIQSGKVVQPSNLIDVWKSFILSAKKEIILNVFDFDLEVVADALIQQAKNGVRVQVGIDQKNVIEVRPEARAISEKLSAHGVQVTGVDAVSLNHQKITAIDWTDVDHAAVLFSSGNLTRSCIDPEGDLKGTVPLPRESVPNANHMLTMKSWLLANLVHHELTKTLTSKIRGREYPLNGSYQITGPGVDPQTFEAFPEPSVTISFTPGGGMKNINKNLIAHFLKSESGRIRMLQFAYSSPEVDEALRFRAEQDYQNQGAFDFLSVGDTPFAMMDWSRFLFMSGYKRIENEQKKKMFMQDPENPWIKSLGDRIHDLRKKVYIAPRIYGNNFVKINGKGVKVNAKIHHKILATENYAILGTSFNFSQGAESNNEQILVFRDRVLADAIDGMVKYLVKTSPGTVHQEAQRINRRGGTTEESSEDPEDKPRIPAEAPGELSAK